MVQEECSVHQEVWEVVDSITNAKDLQHWSGIKSLVVSTCIERYTKFLSIRINSPKLVRKTIPRKLLTPSMQSTTLHFKSAALICMMQLLYFLPYHKVSYQLHYQWTIYLIQQNQQSVPFYHLYVLKQWRAKESRHYFLSCNFEINIQDHHLIYRNSTAS